MSDLEAFVAGELKRPVPQAIAAVAERLARDLGGVAVLFYGSILRTGDIEGVLDFYVLTQGRRPSAGYAWGARWLWPDVSFHEVASGAQTLRAKVATMPLDTFERATAGYMLDTTVWTRFAQPAALAWVQDGAVEQRVVGAVTAAVRTAARFAAALGPERGSADDYWLALFKETYRAEFRVEAPGRERSITSFDPARYATLLPLAWSDGAVPFAQAAAVLIPQLRFDDHYRLLRAWLLRVRVGKALNLARLVKATFTFDGAARYGLWKIERHTGVRIPLTPWRERHPVLAAPEVLWRVFRAAH